MRSAHIPLYKLSCCNKDNVNHLHKQFKETLASEFLQHLGTGGKKKGDGVHM
jgi:hypothetical protein